MPYILLASQGMRQLLSSPILTCPLKFQIVPNQINANSISQFTAGTGEKTPKK
jgi:hypothetical protein